MVGSKSRTAEQVVNRKGDFLRSGSAYKIRGTGSADVGVSKMSMANPKGGYDNSVTMEGLV